MNPFLMLAQAATEQQHQGWLTVRLLGVLTGNAEWVLWLLAGLSVISIAVMLERSVYFAMHRLPNSGDIVLKLAKGDLEGVKADVAKSEGMEAAVLREGLGWVDKGPDSVEQIINATMARERPRYERFLSFLGTLVGIIKAFKDLGLAGAKGGAETVMTGISEALVATAVGLAVAIPAVVGYNILQRSVKNTAWRATALGHALVGHLRATGK